MWILSEKEQKELIKKASHYDYIRFSWPDFNGIPRGRTVPGRNAEHFINDGIWEYTGTICMGPQTEMPVIEKIATSGYGNSRFVPATGLFDLSWAGHGKYKVGQVICEAFWSDNSPVSPAPRTVARRQIERLAEMGYTLYSGFEMEFIVVDGKTMKPVFGGVDYGVDLRLAMNSEWLFDVDKSAANAGINIGAMHPEYSPGQFEFCMGAKYGMETFDGMYMLKEAMKEILPKYGVKPTFMAKPFGNNGGSSGLHFNHSLWDKDGKSAFFDADKPFNMSDTMKYWVGGIMKHINSLVAICSPSPNCHRRLHNPWAPDKADWGIDNRFVSIRVKNRDAGSVLVENRLPSSASNPYLVAAATIAAGIDGIEKKIEPTLIGYRDDNPTLPSLDACLKDLEKNDALNEALGKEFIHWFLTEKRQCEMSKLGAHSMDNVIEEQIEKEREEYFDLI